MVRSIWQAVSAFDLQIGDLCPTMHPPGSTLSWGDFDIVCHTTAVPLLQCATGLNNTSV